jgi:hypothetical protein
VLGRGAGPPQPPAADLVGDDPDPAHAGFAHHRPAVELLLVPGDPGLVVDEHGPAAAPAAPAPRPAGPARGARPAPGAAAGGGPRPRRRETVVAVYRRMSLDVVRAWATCQAACIGPERILLLRDPLDLPLVGPSMAFVPVARNFSRSDHVRFWLAGLPAIQVTNTANFRNPHYHRPSDLPDTLDYDTLAGITAATALLIERLAGEPDRGLSRS